MEADQNPYLEGRTLLIDKEYQWTSFDVVNKIRRTLRIKKVGHAGTLDPLATGLLIVCTGKMTKKLQDFQELPKEYTGELFLGAERPSHDRETEIIKRRSIERIIREDILDAAATFKGEIEQIPPAHSAIKQKGKRVYKLAREGKEVKLNPRKVYIYDFEITHTDLPRVGFRLRCSKGFYVRSLVRDIGEKLGVGSYLETLRRTAIGDFKVEDAITVKEFVSKIRNEDISRNK